MATGTPGSHLQSSPLNDVELIKKACSSKRSYDTRFEAEIASAHYAGDFNDSAITHYKCKFCSHYHIGHPSSRHKRKF